MNGAFFKYKNDLHVTMKRKKIIRLFIFFTLILILGVYFYLKFCWLTLYSFDDMKYNANIVNSSPPLPANFLKVWDRLFPNTRNNGMNKQLWSELTSEIGNSNFYNCRCDEIGYLAWNHDNYYFKFNMKKGIGQYRKFGYGLEYYTTPSKCFDFWYNNAIIWNGKYLKDLDELSEINFKKSIVSLNQLEIIELIVYRNIGYFKAKDSAAFRESVNKLTAKLNEQ